MVDFHYDDGWIVKVENQACVGAVCLNRRHPGLRIVFYFEFGESEARYLGWQARQENVGLSVSWRGECAWRMARLVVCPR